MASYIPPSRSGYVPRSKGGALRPGLQPLGKPGGALRPGLQPIRPGLQPSTSRPVLGGGLLPGGKVPTGPREYTPIPRDYPRNGGIPGRNPGMVPPPNVAQLRGQRRPLNSQMLADMARRRLGG